MVMLRHSLPWFLPFRKTRGQKKPEGRSGPRALAAYSSERLGSTDGALRRRPGQHYRMFASGSARHWTLALSGARGLRATAARQRFFKGADRRRPLHWITLVTAALSLDIGGPARDDDQPRKACGDAVDFTGM